MKREIQKKQNVRFKQQEGKNYEEKIKTQKKGHTDEIMKKVLSSIWNVPIYRKYKTIKNLQLKRQKKYWKQEKNNSINKMTMAINRGD